jgi:hypothetical protein
VVAVVALVRQVTAFTAVMDEQVGLTASPELAVVPVRPTITMAVTMVMVALVGVVTLAVVAVDTVRMVRQITVQVAVQVLVALAEAARVVQVSL